MPVHRGRPSLTASMSQSWTLPASWNLMSTEGRPGPEYKPLAIK